MKDRTWVEISTKNLAHNFKKYKSLLPKETSLMAVIKANAYGHDLKITAEALCKSGVYDFAVFDIEDAILLREKYKDINILVLNQINIKSLDVAFKYNLDITIGDINVLKQIVKHKNIKDLLVNLKIDTGLSRQGLQLNDLPTVIKILKSNPDLTIVSIYTHLIGAENKKFDKYTNKQSHLISIWQEKLNEAGYYPLVHTSATSGFLMKSNLAFDVVRMGIGLYGLWPSEEIKNNSINKLGLKPVLSWKTKVNQVKKINTGDSVAYDATFIAKNDTQIAIIPVGYWDGIPRALSGKGYMLCGGQKCKILGRVMMNMCVIDVTNLKNVKAGDEVVIIGQQGKNYMSVDQMAELAGTINYEIVTRINPLITRIATN